MEEAKFRQRYEERGPWTRILNKTVVKPYFRKKLISELSPIKESEAMKIKNQRRGYRTKN